MQVYKCIPYMDCCSQSTQRFLAAYTHRFKLRLKPQFEKPSGAMKSVPMTTLFGLLLLLTPCVAISNDGKAAGSRTITQVVELLEGMMAKSKEDGASERKLYAKFKCYCDTNTAEKTSEIDSLTEEISILETQIESLQSSTGGLSQQVAQLDADMASNEQSRNSAQSLREKSSSAFLALQTDLTGAIAQMKSALETLSEVGADQTTAGAAADSKFAMAGYGGSLLAKKVQTSVKAALIAANVLMNGKVEKKQVIESFIQAPPSAEYAAAGLFANLRVKLATLGGVVG